MNYRIEAHADGGFLFIVDADQFIRWFPTEQEARTYATEYKRNA